uniref:Uncharacterized protein LOC102809857 n=1 Tax=Saccoglossus kowalevskii TaxID=10224 RepID=A0ABM0LZ86_SACKO|nr:PREDICTED: uncharacterized protein LOC102809857 [Saccoglossus kowalevskii]
MAHQLRLGQTGKCVGYDDFELVVEDCYDPSSTLKHHFSQDFKLTPCDNCHDTELNLLDILEFMIRICNFGDANTERNWSAMIEMSTFGHVIARGRIEQSGDNSGHFVGEKPAPFPLSLFTRMITLEAYVTLTSNQVHFSITAIYSNPSVYFVDEFCSPLMTSFVIPLVASVNSGGFKEFDDSRSSLLCRNDCYNTYNGLCDDGGPGSDFDLCWYGSDCYDCGARPVLCTNGCEFPHDGLCDDGGYNSDYYVCNYGDDCADCGVRVPES